MPLHALLPRNCTTDKRRRCTLASTGGLSDALDAELDQLREEVPVEIESWLDALAEYVDMRDDPRPINRWHDLWPTAVLKTPPAEHIGHVEETGWFGLLRHQDRPGGVIVVHDRLGFRTFMSASSNEELAYHWGNLVDQNARFYRESDGYKSGL